MLYANRQLNRSAADLAILDIGLLWLRTIDEQFDRAFLDLSTRGDHRLLLEEITVDRMEEAGIGGTSEILSWYPVLGATGECVGESLGYTGWTNFRCGIGGVIWDLNSKRH